MSPVQSQSATARFSASRVRRDFLDFFAQRGHVIVPSSPVFPQDDPTLLFTNAGMNQFKDVFLGTGTRDYKRAVDTQKCIRASGKHNDLEDVGVDTYHHTFFEMLGNWSFGDYFKEDAIPWAWELLTKVWGLPPERLWVTVFAGDEKDGLPADTEAERIWIEKAGIDRSRVLRFGRKDNFWEMGETGPCGPCTEIHIDRGGPGTDPKDGADRKIGVNAGNERFMELWNNVFMQFNRLDDGSLRELPAKSVDTGMGFERVLGVLQGKKSNYDTDLFAPLFTRIAALTGKRYGAGEERVDIAFRVCADHMRAVTAALSDGAVPGNTGRGYVLRRLIRRAARFGQQELGTDDPFLFELSTVVAEILGDTFPEMRARLPHVREVVKVEEESFGRTLGRGLSRFEDLRTKVTATGAKAIPGDVAFELYATYGFPRDLVELMARERGLTVGAAEWDKAEKAHQDASRSEGKFKQLLSAEQLERLKATVSTYHDSGERARRLETDVQLFQVGTPGRNDAKLVLSESPFYPEGGGQVGDEGTIQDVAGRWKFAVADTRRIGGVIVHLGKTESGDAPRDGAPLRVIAEADWKRRDRTRKHHTATHLMHKAMKLVLGEHVGQQGSYVGPDRLRFDFSHPKAVSAEELERIETLVNEQIIANHGVKTTVEDLDAAKARGVVAMFGEKYDAKVRVLDVGGWSLELCGGTHVRETGDIGPFVITLERAVSAGVRRIEAVTGQAAVAEIQRQRRVLTNAARALKTAPEEVEARIEQLLSQLKESKKKAEATSTTDITRLFKEAEAALRTASGVSFGWYTSDALDQKGVNDLVDRLKAQHPALAVAVFGRHEGKAPWVISCTGAALERGVRANQCVPELKKLLGGGGGGSPEKAQGQGMNPDGVSQAGALVLESFASQLGAQSSH